MGSASTAQLALLLLLVQGCGSEEGQHEYSECRVEYERVYYELVSVEVDGELVGNAMRAPELLLRRHYSTDLGRLKNYDTEDEPYDTGDDLGLDLWRANIYYVRQ